MALAFDPQSGVRTVARPDRAVQYILATVFLVDILTTLIVFGYGNNYLIKIIEAPSAAPAFALGVYGLVKFVTAPLSGLLTDRAAARVSVVLAAVLQAGGLGVMLAVRDAAGFIVGAGILSAGTTLLWLLVFHALASAVKPEARGSATAYMGIVTSIGVGAGFAAAAVLAEARPALVFLVGAVLGGGSALLLWPVFGSGTVHRPRDVEDEPAEAPRTSRPEWAASAVTFAHFFAVNATIGALGPFALEQLDLSLRQVAGLLAPAIVVAGLAMLLIGRRSRQGRRLREATPVYALGAVALLATAFSPQPLSFAVGMAFVGAAVGGATPLLNSARVDLTTLSSAPGRMLGRVLFAEGLGSFIGPIAVGLVIAVGDIRAGAVAAALMFGAVTLVTAAAARLVRL